MTVSELEVFHDPSGVFARGALLLEYGRAALQHKLGATTFLWDDAVLGRLRIWIHIVDESASSAEVTVSAERDSFGLTRRELQVLSLMAGGLSNNEISDDLGTHVKTIATHVTHILLKLDQLTRAGAAAVAVDQGLILLPLPSTGGQLIGLSPGLLHATATRRWRTTGVSHRARPPAVVRQPLQIGCILPQGGSDSDADDARKGAQLAVSRINRSGGIHGRRVDLVIGESNVWSHDAMTAASSQLVEQGVDALLFGYNLDFRRIGELLQHLGSYGVPVLHATTSDSALALARDNPDQFQSVFHLGGADRFYGEGFFRTLSTLHNTNQWRPRNRRVAVLDSFAGSLVLTDHTANRALDAGWDIHRIPGVGDRPHPDTATVLHHIDKVDAATLLLPTFLDEDLLLQILAGVRQRHESTLVYCLYTPSLPGFVDRAGRLAEGLVWSTMTGRYADHIGSMFVNDFEHAFGRRPGYSQAGLHYDAVTLLCQSWADVAQPRHLQDVQQRLRQIVHRGVDGVYWLGGRGQTSLSYPDETADPSLAQAHLVFQIQNGDHQIIAPAPYANAIFRPPDHPTQWSIVPPSAGLAVQLHRSSSSERR